MRVCCVSIDTVTNDVKETVFACSQTSKDSIKNIIKNKLVEFLGNGEYTIKTTDHHVCAIGNGKIGFGCPVKSITKLSDSLRVYAKDWTEVDNYLKSLKPEELTTSELLEKMREKYDDFTLTNIYYRLKVNNLSYKKSPRGKRRNHYSL